MYVQITSDPIQVSEVLASVGSSADGAILLFTGIVRNHSEGQPVTAVQYEAYRGMAEQVLREIAQEASERLGTDRLAVVHRVGDLAVGDVSVAIAVSSPHRAESFAACRYVIEEIKVRLPVWKRERFVGGEARWAPGRALAPSPAAGV
ncbi:MAG: molybdenum cofactor biosynthesis protein MoaE [Gemmatimonadetes bacterium]|nr:molybdenum cofactor biosynthesis protein MoaE [Gemmatimonadota bacterium]